MVRSIWIYYEIRITKLPDPGTSSIRYPQLKKFFILDETPEHKGDFRVGNDGRRKHGVVFKPYLSQAWARGEIGTCESDYPIRELECSRSGCYYRGQRLFELHSTTGFARGDVSVFVDYGNGLRTSQIMNVLSDHAVDLGIWD